MEELREAFWALAFIQDRFVLGRDYLEAKAVSEKTLQESTLGSEIRVLYFGWL
jgi:hypothetical protein